MRICVSALTGLSVVLALAACDRKSAETATPTPNPQGNAFRPSQTVRQNSVNNLRSTPTPAPITTDEQGKARIKNLLLEMRNSSDPVAFSETKWKEYWKPAFEQPWISAGGASLNQLIEGFATGQQLGFNQVLKEKREAWTTDPELRTSAIALATLCASVFSAPSREDAVPPASLPQIMSAYQNAMPVAVGDVMMYRMVTETAAFFESRPKMPEGQFPAWQEMARAKNPIYRLMALEVFGKFEATPEQAQAFYSTYLEENELGINRALAKNLAGHETPWAVEALAKVKAKLPKN